MSTELLEPEVKESKQAQTAWNTVVWDDPVNTMQYVVFIFQKVLNFTAEQAEQKMMEVHTQGKSIVYSGSKETSEFYAHSIQSYGLQATIEQA